MTLVTKKDFSLYGFIFDKGFTCPSMPLDAKHDMWTYLVLYSVKWKYWINPCRKNEILDYMPTSLINGMFELLPWCETWYATLFDFVFGKMEVLEWPCLESIWFLFGKMKVLEWLGREKAFLVYMHTNLINGKFELIPWCETWYVNLFGFVFGKMKVLEWLCPENYILVYMPTSLRKGKFEIVPWCETWYVNLFYFKFGKMTLVVRFDKWEVWTCPLMRYILFKPIWIYIR